MTERFTTVELPKPNKWGIWYDGAYLSTYQVCILLNEYVDVKKENEQLRNKKERYKRLSEIRQQEINNRILTIKEFIDDCSDNKVKSALKELFYSEVNEYDLSSENRKLLNENEQLKKDATILIYSNQDYRQENENLKKQLDYIQNLINEHIKHQKTELGQNALKEIIQDYNDWLLGHEEVKE